MLSSVVRRSDVEGAETWAESSEAERDVMVQAETSTPSANASGAIHGLFPAK